MKTIFAFATLLLSPSLYGEVPKPPPQICIDNNCVSASMQSGDGKKWHPGHYLKTQGVSTESGYQESVTAQLNKTLGSDLIRGAFISYAWGTLEPSDGKYNWSPVHEHLNWLKAHGKSLIVDLEYKSFGAAGVGSLVPSDLQGSVVIGTSSNTSYIAALWRQPEMDRFIRFLRAFAAEFDGDEALELVRTSESAPSFQNGAPADYTSIAYATQLKRMYAVMSSAFVRTNVTASVNSLNNSAAELIEAAYQLGMGLSSPDAIDDNGARIFRGEQVSGQGTAVRDYRGLAPHEVIASKPTLDGKEGVRVPAEVIGWAVSNKVTHLSWVATLSGERSWAAILDAISRPSSALLAVCPKNYRSCGPR